jgi:hypothetical protein
MAERRQLPPQIRRVELDRRAGSKTVVRYQLTVDTGTAEGKRKQLRRRYRTEKEARAALAEIQGQEMPAPMCSHPRSRSSRPHNRLPTHRRTKRPQTEKGPNLKQVQTYSDVVRNHMVGLTGFEPATT